MDNLHRQYLDAMGVDVYSIRVLSEKVASMQVDLSPQAPVAGSDETLNRVETPSSVTALRQQLKAQLGDEKTEVAGTKVKAAENDIAVPLNKTEDDPRFFFCFLDYENISLMVSLPVNAGGLPSEHRQLCDDIVFALIKERKIPKVRELRWPMVSAAHIQQGAEDARLIIGEMISQCHDSLVLFGDVTANYRAEKKQGTYLLVEEIEHYLSNPQAKPELWLKLTPLFLAR